LIYSSITQYIYKIIYRQVKIREITYLELTLNKLW